MLTLDKIINDTIYVVRFTNGHRERHLKNELSNYSGRSDVKDIDRIDTRYQPKELQPFYEAMDFAWRNNLDESDLNTEEFYKVWIKNPDRFSPQSRPVIGSLSEYLERLKPDGDVIVKNFDKRGAGNHRVKNFIVALKLLDCDFDVVDFIEASGKYSYDTITIQTTDIELLNKLSAESNRAAIADSFG